MTKKLTIDFKEKRLVLENGKRLEIRTTDQPDSTVEGFKIDLLSDVVLNELAMLKGAVNIAVLSK